MQSESRWKTRTHKNQPHYITQQILFAAAIGSEKMKITDIYRSGDATNIMMGVSDELQTGIRNQIFAFQ